MVAGDKRDTGMFSVLAEQLLDEDILFSGPMPFSAQLPAIDEIADEIELLAFRLTKKIQQLAHLRMPGSQVNVRNPYGSIIHAAGPIIGADALRSYASAALGKH